MKILVCIKQVNSLGDEIAFNGDNTDVDPDYIEGALNEWDSFATEEAVLIRERLEGDAEILLASVGDETVEPALRRCLAMGGDRAIRVEGQSSHDPISIACSLADIAKAENPDLIFCGVQSSDSVQSATGSAMAGLLDLPLAAVVTRLDLDPSASKVTVQRELEGGLTDIVEVQTPAVLTIQSGINSPRYATFRAIKQADKKEIKVTQAGHTGHSGYHVRKMFEPLKGERAEMLGTDAAEVAGRIAGLIKEAVS